jgi:DNA-binding response OmpR family regulator
VIVLVPGSAEGGAAEAYAAGADDCVAKPFTGDDLRRRLAARSGDRDARAAS